MKTLITNILTLGRFLSNFNDNDKDENGIYSCELFIENEKILRIVEKSNVTQVDPSIDSLKVDKVIDGKGLFLSPGLIDPQVHFREPGLEYKEDIESGSKTAAKGGFTTVISMPNTLPTADNADVVKMMFDKQASLGLCRVLPTGAVSVGLKGEELTDFATLKKAGAVALTDDGKGIQSEKLFKEALVRAKELDMVILDHSEDQVLSDNGCIHLGDVSRKFDVKGINSESEAVHVERGCRLSGETGGRYHVLHISTAKSLDYVRSAKIMGFPVTAEVSPHHLLLCDEDIPVKSDGFLDANWKMNPPLRSKFDRSACVEALMDGTIDAIATDHAPHAPDEKNKNIEDAPFGIIGLETSFPLMYTHFVKQGNLTLSRLIYLMTEGPAKLFNLPLGTLSPGASADFTLLDLERAEEVRADSFASKSKNSPFIGQKLFGHAKLTVYKGNVVYNTLCQLS